MLLFFLLIQQKQAKGHLCIFFFFLWCRYSIAPGMWCNRTSKDCSGGGGGIRPQEKRKRGKINRPSSASPLPHRPLKEWGRIPLLFSFIDGPPQKGKGKKEEEKKASKKSRGDEIPKASIGISQKKMGKKKRGRHEEFSAPQRGQEPDLFIRESEWKNGPHISNRGFKLRKSHCWQQQYGAASSQRESSSRKKWTKWYSLFFGKKGVLLLLLFSRWKKDRWPYRRSLFSFDHPPPPKFHPLVSDSHFGRMKTISDFPSTDKRKKRIAILFPGGGTCRPSRLAERFYWEKII